MDKDKFFQQIKQLFFDHKQATALEDEYTTDIYDYLYDNGYMQLSKEKKFEVWEDAKRSYYTMLKQIVNMGDEQEAYVARRKIIDLKYDMLKPEYKAEVVAISKRRCLMDYFDSIEQLPPLK